MNNNLNLDKNLSIICQKFNLEKSQKIETLYNNLWVPLTLKLANKFYDKSKPLLVGVLGVQGTGKTTLTRILKYLLAQINISSETISLDDFYKTYEERKKLQQFDPRLIWRGPPLTHDVPLALNVLQALLESRPVVIPRFDKSLHNGKGDRAAPLCNRVVPPHNSTPLGHKITHRTEIIFFEGWFVGVQPIDENKFNQPPYPIITEHDKKFARDCNQRLKKYLPLWKLIDYQIILNPLDYRYSLPWRQEAEEKMKAQGKKGMSRQEIQEFVEYFWKALHPELFISTLIDNLSLTNSLVITIDKDHFCQDYIIKIN